MAPESQVLRSTCRAGLTLYLLDLVYRLAQWMNTSAVTGSLVSENLLTLDLRFDPVSTPCMAIMLLVRQMQCPW